MKIFDELKVGDKIFRVNNKNLDIKVFEVSDISLHSFYIKFMCKCGESIVLHWIDKPLTNSANNFYNYYTSEREANANVYRNIEIKVNKVADELNEIREIAGKHYVNFEYKDLKERLNSIL